MIITQYGKNVDGDSMNLTKVLASQGECKPDMSRGFQNITPKLQAEPSEVSPAGVHRYMKAYK